MRVGARLRKLRKESGWRLEDLAARAGLSRAYLSRLEGGERQPSLGALFDVARAYDFAPSSLFEPEPEAQGLVVVRSTEGRARRGPTGSRRARNTLAPDRAEERFRRYVRVQTCSGMCPCDFPILRRRGRDRCGTRLR